MKACQSKTNINLWKVRDPTIFILWESVLPLPDPKKKRIWSRSRHVRNLSGRVVHVNRRQNRISGSRTRTPDRTDQRNKNISWSTPRRQYTICVLYYPRYCLLLKVSSLVMDLGTHELTYNYLCTVNSTQVMEKIRKQSSGRLINLLCMSEHTSFCGLCMLFNKDPETFAAIAGWHEQIDRFAFGISISIASY